MPFLCLFSNPTYFCVYMEPSWLVQGWVQLRWASLWLDILSKLGQELSVAKKMSGLSSIGETENYLFKSRTLNCIPTPLSNNHENATKIVMPEMFLVISFIYCQKKSKIVKKIFSSKIAKYRKKIFFQKFNIFVGSSKYFCPFQFHEFCYFCALFLLVWNVAIWLLTMRVFSNFRMMMVITWLLTMAGFVLIFAELGWKWTAIPISENPHPLLGCVTTGLCFIQPFMALFRPHPGASKYV